MTPAAHPLAALPRFVRSALFVGGVVAGLGRVGAQDVTVTPPKWTVERDAPHDLPVSKSAARIEFPDELKSTPDIGYVVFDLVLDAKGKIQSLQPRATLAAYERAAWTKGSLWSPGKRDGKGVNTATSYAVIFNPASAAEKKPDATPRLLEVSVVPIKARKGTKPNVVIPDRVELADVSVDEQGNVTAVKNAPADLAADFAIAVKNWRFAPARTGGKPVAAEVRMPFVVTVRDDLSFRVDGKRSQPRVTDQERPIYPFAMRANGMKGEVIVDFIVDLEGRVRNAYVVRSLNPSFDDPAIEAVRRWKFEPGRIGERPVNTHMQVPIIFTLDETFNGGQGPLSAAKKADLSKLPEPFRYDTPPRPVGTVRPVYPYALLRAKKEGKAVVRYIVDPKGRVVQADIGTASAPELGRALQAAIECFVYEPAIKAGRPSPALQSFGQEFNRDAMWQLVDDEDLELLRREEKKPASILSARDLDRPITPLSRRPPRFPLSVKEEVTKGEALIEFLIDEEGRARLPRIVSASEEAFGYAAVQGVATWRFEPPTRGGKPVVVRAQIPLSFGVAEVAPPSRKK